MIEQRHDLAPVNVAARWRTVQATQVGVDVGGCDVADVALKRVCKPFKHALHLDYVRF